MILLISLLFACAPVFISACEAECISGITHALIGNYSRPFNTALTNIANSISSQIIQNPNDQTNPLSYLTPFINEYNTRSYDYMVNTIFKTYFHGKCQNPATGIDPPGCPNPDCPVVCGTSGSMVHFYRVFRYRAYNSTVNVWNEITNPKSATYQGVERAILAAAGSRSRSNTNSGRALRFMRFANSNLTSAASTRKGDLNLMGSGQVLEIEKRQEALKNDLQVLIHDFRNVLAVVCGGDEVSGKANGLPNCSWEQAFKDYMLTFP